MKEPPIKGIAAGQWVTIACAALSLAGATATGYFTYKAQTASSNVEMAKLALGMLEAPETSADLREWAINILGEYTSVPIKPSRRGELSKAIANAGGVDLSGGKVEAKNIETPDHAAAEFVTKAPELNEISGALKHLRLPIF